MAKPKIDAKEALDAIRAGADDQELMARYSVSAKGLQSLLTKLVEVGAVSVEELEKRVSESRGNVVLPPNISELSKSGPRGRLVNAHQAAADVKAGMGDRELMEKYKLSAKGLQDLLDQLLTAGLLSPSEVDRSSTWVDSTVDLMGILKDLGMDRTPKREGAGSRAVTRCSACGAPQTMEFDECPICGADLTQSRAEAPEVPEAPPWVCPACGRSQDRSYDECPVCGIVVAKYVRERTGEGN